MPKPLAAILVLGAGLWTAGCPASVPETAAAGAVRARAPAAAR